MQAATYDDRRRRAHERREQYTRGRIAPCGADHTNDQEIPNSPTNSRDTPEHAARIAKA